jgi:hypothetical protein
MAYLDENGTAQEPERQRRNNTAVFKALTEIKNMKVHLHETYMEAKHTVSLMENDHEMSDMINHIDALLDDCITRMNMFFEY